MTISSQGLNRAPFALLESMEYCVRGSQWVNYRVNASHSNEKIFEGSIWKPASSCVTSTHLLWLSNDLTSSVASSKSGINLKLPTWCQNGATVSCRVKTMAVSLGKWDIGNSWVCVYVWVSGYVCVCRCVFVCWLVLWCMYCLTRITC